jgi:hypothetical protein
VLHAATVAALNGQPFPHLGSSALAGLAVRAASRLPWSVLRGVYTRIGASEGINPKRLGDVNLAAVAESFADPYPRRRYPAILLGSSNGALTHLSAAMQVPWLPDTVLVPVARVGDTDRPDQAMEFGRSVAPALLDRNPDIVLHHMHDQLQDVLMAERMSYFRVKWSRLPDAYAAFVEDHLAPGGTVVVVNDSSSWPVTRLGLRHVFQAGGRGGTPPEGYLARPHTPAPNDEAAESEWGLDPAFRDHVRTWCDQHGYRYAEIGYVGPQTSAAAVATIIRDWYRAPWRNSKSPRRTMFHSGRPLADDLRRSRAVLDSLRSEAGVAVARRLPCPGRAISGCERVLVRARHPVTRDCYPRRLPGGGPSAWCGCTLRWPRSPTFPPRHWHVGPVQSGI